ISRVIIKLASGARQGGEGFKKFADVAGQSVADFSEQMKTRPAEAVAAFIAGLGRVQSSGGDLFAVLQDLGMTEIRLPNPLLLSANASDYVTQPIALGS